MPKKNHMPALSFKAQFVEPIESGKKAQTIRAISKRRPPQVGETLYLYYAMRTKQCRKIGEAICESVTAITITATSIRIGLVGDMLSPRALYNFAQADGFASWEDLVKFWIDNHGPACFPFTGLLIRWHSLKHQAIIDSEGITKAWHLVARGQKIIDGHAD
jgi:hypothetical protein